MPDVLLPYAERERFLPLVASLAESGPVFVYLHGHRDANGASWCPDCRRSEPTIRAALSPDATLLLLDGGDKPTWKDPGNYYRHLAEVKGTAVPTLIKWGAQGEIARLVDVPDCADDAKLKALTES
ncbi:hypothetical protein DFJ74DRAFT_700946 [Hyaloraphidium curvatum]|nr:hypothetical protein DFJ74DRAFT_700946 [Hyaloraphidium curvatum]